MSSLVPQVFCFLEESSPAGGQEEGGKENGSFFPIFFSSLEQLFPRAGEGSAGRVRPCRQGVRPLLQ